MAASPHSIHREDSMTKSYAALMQMARERHAALVAEMKALEAAFPEIHPTAQSGKRVGRTPGFKVSDEARQKMRVARRAWWAQKKANGQAVEQSAPTVTEAPEYAAEI